jgi:hypothetical protein
VLRPYLSWLAAAAAAAAAAGTQTQFHSKHRKLPRIGWLVALCVCVCVCEGCGGAAGRGWRLATEVPLTTTGPSNCEYRQLLFRALRTPYAINLVINNKQIAANKQEKQRTQTGKAAQPPPTTNQPGNGMGEQRASSARLRAALGTKYQICACQPRSKQGAARLPQATSRSEHKREVGFHLALGLLLLI